MSEQKEAEKWGEAVGYAILFPFALVSIAWFTVKTFCKYLRITLIMRWQMRKYIPGRTPPPKILNEWLEMMRAASKYNESKRKS